MQSVEISGLREVITKLDVAPELIREARAEFFAEAGASLLSDVQGRIGGTGKIAGVQEYRVGSGKGYVAVRAMSANTPPVISPMRWKTGMRGERHPGRPNESGAPGRKRVGYPESICTATPPLRSWTSWRRPAHGALKSLSRKSWKAEEGSVEDN